MNPAYYDTTYLLKLQIVENGTLEVREHASSVREISPLQLAHKLVGQRQTLAWPEKRRNRNRQNLRKE